MSARVNVPVSALRAPDAVPAAGPAVVPPVAPAAVLDAAPAVAAPAVAAPAVSATRDDRFDVVVVGAGHAGCEAAAACAKLGLHTALLTVNLEDTAKIIDIDDFHTLKAFTRKHITERFGKILQWREYEEPTR